MNVVVTGFRSAVVLGVVAVTAACSSIGDVAPAGSPSPVAVDGPSVARPTLTASSDQSQPAIHDALRKGAPPAQVLLGCQPVPVSTSTTTLEPGTVLLTQGGTTRKHIEGVDGYELVVAAGKITHRGPLGTHDPSQLPSTSYLLQSTGAVARSVQNSPAMRQVVAYDHNSNPTSWPGEKRAGHRPEQGPLGAWAMGYYWQTYEHFPLGELPPETSYVIAGFVHGDAHRGRPHDIIFEHGRDDEAVKDQIARSTPRNLRWLISVGGGGNLAKATRLTTDQDVAVLLKKLSAIVDQYGFRGVDLDLEGGPTTYTDDAIVRLVRGLKAQYGPDFLVTMTPRPFEVHLTQLAATLYATGDLDYVQFQFYDQPQITSAQHVTKWAASVMDCAHSFGVPYSRMMMGAKISGDDQTMTTPASYRLVAETLRETRGLGGTYLWHLGHDASASWVFHKELRSLR